MSAPRRWTAHVIAALVVLFLAFDGITKVILLPQVVQASAPLGFTVGMLQGIGVLLLVLIVVYVIPATSIFGAVLLTGYLGGATVTNLRAGEPAFEVLMPVIFGVLVWAPVYIRNDRLRALIPFRRPTGT